MNELPEFWRTEVYHPLSVHFPIALLITALIFKLISLKIKRELWRLGSTVLLSMGLLGIWIAVYTGNLADGSVSRKICDPTILKDHENLAYTTSWVFTAALVVELLQFLKIPFLSGRKILNLVVALLMLVGSGFLTYVGHLGATLVYQQGAGVYIPSKDCSEFN